MSILRPALLVFILLSLITGAAYPLLVTGLSQAIFPSQANGSLISVAGKVRGSELIGQAFDNPADFHGRPSATAGSPYNALASAGSNLAASNPALDKLIAERVTALRAANPLATGPVPLDLVTASASGLDPQISPAAAYWQAPRVAEARGMSLQQLNQLIASQIHTPLIKFTGEATVNVLMLNLALDGSR
ncbi:potassium-transporting ATPase subunit KdpC [Erwiniaceae bacterium BAC15a-03b]|uniref:Potassium-transporting ATPase KdpC subunit n=1 Tax=Winslowiella arboricola TaxID=2978220 RepID=A0A9J6PS71_9GAMM|nr:potassium-transporting ATPase subunit KdpC [Winslowiella arboricola]MCU5774164.1 potassium-transporting ATPase subunit KdpC [Winslowiella arboricola]MCU5776903.1 potassium-transporting ATPase subunit KdpC [Winslowiella arboricola]